jgi:predicted negative regulator of RcsB-dependent stress response
MEPRGGIRATKIVGKRTIAQGRASLIKRDWLGGLLLILAVILVYQPVWSAGFIWDDDLMLTANPCIAGPLGLKEIWTTSAADICPFTLTTFWIEHALWGLAPLPYHLVNVLMHAACAVVLWRVLLRLQVPKSGAWLGAALWALHPVQVESVAWIAEMKNTESVLFFLLSILFFLRWLKAKDPNEQTGDGWSYALTLLFAALAMASKSSTVVLPIVLCLCAWWMEGRWHGRSLARIAPTFLMSIAAGAVSIWTQGRHLTIAADPKWSQTWPERLVTAGDAVWFYLGKLLWPHPLITIYPRWKTDAGEWASYLPLMAVVISILILCLKRDLLFRCCRFVFAYFLITLLPTLGLLSMSYSRNSFVADRFQYLASMGPLAFAGAGLAWAAASVIFANAWLQSTLCAGLLLVLGMLSWQQAGVYQSQETLWTHTLAKNPDSWAAQNGRGYFLLQNGQMDEAEPYFQKALEIYPNYAEAHYNLGIVLFQKGQVDEAIAHFQKALEINPLLAEAYDNLGTAFAREGRFSEAMTKFQEALRLNPRDVNAQNNLAKVQAIARQTPSSK